MHFDLDPTPQRVVIIAVLEFLLMLLGSLTVILQEGNMPTPYQWATIITVSLLGLVAYLLSFVKGEE